MRFRKRSDDTPMEPSVAEEVDIDVTIPRECVYHNFAKHPGSCPRCGGVLQQSHQTYLVQTGGRRGSADSFMIGSNVGWFCSDCPTVVFNPQQVKELIPSGTGLSRWDVGEQCMIVGIINWDAVPPEKAHLPVGEEDNPIPVVEFTHSPSVRALPQETRARRRQHKKRKPPGKRKRHR